MQLTDEENAKQMGKWCKGRAFGSAFLTPEKALDLECALGSKIKTEKCAGGASETPRPQMRKPARANGGFARGTRNRGGENHESNACE